MNSSKKIIIYGNISSNRFVLQQFLIGWGNGYIFIISQFFFRSSFFTPLLTRRILLEKDPLYAFELIGVVVVVLVDFVDFCLI